ncbi:uncharacterized protein C8Q71DRAFT_538448 [Rhodofomes roseus]|uniref:Uncharacterized protein n=1 Tax=Rhodofomes roseus TaxID=34475 RepID=A0ABQ8KKG8_9APHY|nr:uncharacterized protein C8Q71DRAFT_538448 [Rhodofomes roseus]KAH9838610.1 hypothetical protein C8Q71DRAFT_538448 [Rhodofomes roseus]
MSTILLQLDSDLGCIFIGVMFSAMFYGATCAQTMYYSWHYLQHDKVYQISHTPDLEGCLTLSSLFQIFITYGIMLFKDAPICLTSSSLQESGP